MNPDLFLEQLQNLRDNTDLFEKVFLLVQKGIKEAQGGIWISAIQSSGLAGQKLGTRVMQALSTIADQTDTILALEAEMEADDDWWRVSYFEQFGFYETGDCGEWGPIMQRDPE